MNGDEPLKGRTVLVVEDEWFIASYVACGLEDAGARVLGPVPTAADALAMLGDENGIDAATLNVRLGDGDSAPVAERLAGMGVPFLFLSGQDTGSRPAGFRDRPGLAKPFAAFQVVEAVAGLIPVEAR